MTKTAEKKIKEKKKNSYSPNYPFDRAKMSLSHHKKKTKQGHDKKTEKKRVYNKMTQNSRPRHTFKQDEKREEKFSRVKII